MKAEHQIIYSDAIENDNIKSKIFELIQNEISENNEAIILTAGRITDRKSSEDTRYLGDNDFYASHSEPYILNISLRIQPWDNSFDNMKTIEEIQAQLNEDEK